MKIGLCVTHGGLTKMLLDIFEDHEVVIHNNSVFTENQIRFTDEDVIISTFPYRDLDYLDKSKPLIIYATNPFTKWTDNLLKLQEQDWVTVVDYDEGKPYLPELFPIKPKFSIPHCIKPGRFPKWIGDRDYIVVANQKVTDRIYSLTSGVYGKDIAIEDLLYGVPYIIPHLVNNDLFHEILAHSKGVFYFSNNPDTLFLFECMSMGIPMVGFDAFANHKKIKVHPVRKYLKYYSTNPRQIRQWLLDFIRNKYDIINYNYVPFNEVKKRWNEVLNYAISKHSIP